MNLARARVGPRAVQSCSRCRPPYSRASSGSAEVVGRTAGVGFLPDGIPISGIAGDQQAALFGQACFREGDAKCTYGTGAFALMNIGERPLMSQHGLVTTAAWRVGGKTTYARFEGERPSSRARRCEWLPRDGLGIIKQARDIEALARKVESSDGVAFVPALAGLGAPYWDPDARGTITGLTRGTTAAHPGARDASRASRSRCMTCSKRWRRTPGVRSARLRVDGGASAQRASHAVPGRHRQRSAGRREGPPTSRSTGRGAAMLARLGAGLYRNHEDVAKTVSLGARFEPAMSASERATHLKSWHDAIERSRSAM